MTEARSQKRQLLVILTIVFLGFVGISMPYLIFPALFLNPSYSILPIDTSESSRAFLLGITLASYPLGQFIGSPILGALSDDYGRKKLLWGSLLITGICNLFTGIAIAKQHLGMLIISRLIAGIMEGNIAIARAMAADFKTISKHKTFGKMNAVTSISYLIGPLLGGVLTDKSLFVGLSMSTPFFVICILFFLLSGLSGLLLKKSVVQSSTEARTVWQRLNFIKRMSVLFTNKQLKFLIISGLSFTLAVDIFFEFGPVYLTVKWALGPAQLILYNSILCIALAIGSGGLPSFFSSPGTNYLSIIGGIGGFALFLIGMIVTESIFSIMILFALSGLVIGLASTLITIKISDSVSDTIQGEVMGIQISLRVLGDGLICLCGGGLLIVSSKLILLIAVILSLFSMIYYKIRHKFSFPSRISSS